MTHANDPNRRSEQVERVILSGDSFDPARPFTCARAPGRLDFMGGNVDYTGGLVLQIPTRESIWAVFQPSPQPTLRVFNPGAAEFGWETRLEIRSSELSSLASIEDICQRVPQTTWGKYVFGALHLLRQRYGSFAVDGGSLFLASDLPPNRGVASSAALVIAVLKAVCSAQGIGLDGVALATAGQWVENIVAHSACGIMDHAAIVLGAQSSLLPIRCQPCEPGDPIALPEGLRIWGVDSMVPRSTSGEAYETARAAAFMGYKLICQWEKLDITFDDLSLIPRWTDARWNGYLSNIRAADFREKYEPRLPESITGEDFLRLAGEHIDPISSIKPAREYPVRAAARYAIEENSRVETIKTMMETTGSCAIESSLRTLGKLIAESHAAYAECGLGSAACNELVNLAHDFGFQGAKMTGGGAGGVVAILGTVDQQEALGKLVSAYAARRGVHPHVFEGSSNGAEVSVDQILAPSPFEAIH
jgi:L-arabinokinase